MEYEWNEVKRRANTVKHRIDFVAIGEFEWEDSYCKANHSRQ